MLKFSLVIATLNRSSELDTLLASLSEQHYPELECIIVDQNTNGLLLDIVSRWQQHLNIRVVQSAPGLSRARNIGLAYATGDVIAFPDDDCWYPPMLLEQISAWFEGHLKYNILTVGAQDEQGVPSGNRWMQNKCDISWWNAFRTTFSSTIFLRNRPGLTAHRFDPTLGVGSGTPFACGEETDYVLRLLREGDRGYFDRRLHVGHPRRDMLSGTIPNTRARGYGMGMGRVLRKRSRLAFAISLVAYDLVRAGLVALKGNSKAATLSLVHGQGIALGYLSGYVDLPATPNRRRVVWASSHPHLDPQLEPQRS